MKTEREIREKVEELMDVLPQLKSDEVHEAGCNQIDALLWVLDDRSGGELLV